MQGLGQELGCSKFATNLTAVMASKLIGNQRVIYYLAPVLAVIAVIFDCSGSYR